jgi:uncharacterized iron-regulated membrane protein
MSHSTWSEDDDALLRLVAAALQPAPLSREDVVAAGRAAYPWLALRVVRADPDRRARSGGRRSTRPPPRG